MPNRQDDENRDIGGGDRERQREVSKESRSGQGNTQGGGSRRSNRGFASMDREKQREIASKGGRAAHAKGTAHEFDSGEAREAGRKGGVAVSQNRDHMAMIGRRGGEARGQARSGSGEESNEHAEGGARNTEAARQNVSDRQVNLPGQGDRAAASARGTPGGSNSMGGERRPANNNNSNNNNQASDTESAGGHHEDRENMGSH